MIELVMARSPLNIQDAEREVVPVGKSLECIIAERTGAYVPGVDQPIFVFVNCAEVSPLLWAATLPSDGDQVLVLPRPADPATIAYIVITVASAYYSYRMSNKVPNLDRVDMPEASPTAEFNPEGNRARIGSPIPARYGRWRAFPDYASSPSREYVGDDEFVSMIFAVGHGDYDVSQIKIGDTPIENFDDCEYQFYQAGEPVDLVPTAVYNSPEVSGSGLILYGPNEPEYIGWSAPFVAVPAGVQARELVVDVVIPRGLHYQNDEGGLDARSVQFSFAYRAIDDNGEPLAGAAGFWQVFKNEIVTRATVDPVRFTYRHSVPPGRYEVRARRLSNASSDYREADEIRWAALRSVLDDDALFPCFTWAVRIRVTNQLSALAERKFNAVFTRKLPQWTPGDGWSTPALTRNPVWAFCDAIKASYGGKYTDASFESLDDLAALASLYDARGDYFDGQFDTHTTLWRALRQILFVGRAVPVQFGDEFAIVRDGPQSRGFYMFNGRNTKKNSLAISYQTVDEWGDDSVEVEYIDPVTWKPETILCVVPGNAAKNPTRISLFGCTDAAQAYREGMFNAAKQHYRTVSVDFTTELDGAVPHYLDRLQVVAHLPRWGLGGEVVSVEGSPATLVLSEPVDAQEADILQIWLRRDTGVAEGPFDVMVTEDKSRVLLSGEAPAWINTGLLKQRTYFALATEEQQPRTFIADGFTPNAKGEYQIRGVIDAPQVHTFDEMIDNGTLPVPDATPPVLPESLVIEGLYIIHGGTVDAPKLKLVWNPVANATRYIIELRYSESQTWQRIYFGELNFHEFDVARGVVYLRVAALAEVVGPWTFAQADAGNSFSTPQTVSGLSTDGAFYGDTLRIKWSEGTAAASYYVELSAGGVVRWQQAVVEPKFSIGAATAVAAGLTREMDVSVWAVNANNVRSLLPATITVKNEQMLIPLGVYSIVSLRSAHVGWNFPPQPFGSDYAGAILWVYEESGQDLFLAKKYVQMDPLATSIVVPFEEYKTYYFRLALFDAWGQDELNISGEFTDIAAGIRSSDLAQELETEIERIEANANDLADEILERMTADDLLANELANEILDRISADDINASGLAQEIFDRAAADGLLQTAVNGNAAAIVAEQTARADADSALSSTINGLAAQVGDNAAAILVEQTARADADTALSQQITTISAGGADNSAAILAERTARIAADEALSQDVLELFAGVDDNAAAILNEQTARVAANSAFTNAINALTGYVGDNAAAILAEQTARADADTALSQQITTVIAGGSDNSAAIVAEQTARIAADEALSLDVLELFAGMDDNAAAILSEQTARATADAAFTNTLNGLAADVGDNAAAIVAEQSARADGDEALGQQLVTIAADVGDNAAAIAAEQTARADGDSAIAGQLSTLQVEVGGYSGAIQSSAQAVAELDGEVANIKLEQYIKLDNNGYVTGYGAYNDGPGASGFIVRADAIGFGHPDAAGTIFPVVLQGGVLYITGTVIQDGTITNAKIGDEIKSNNFVAGSTGWRLLKDGDAEFNGATIRSTLQSNNFVAGSAGWRLQNTGAAEFRNVVVRGDVEASSLKAGEAIVQTANIVDASVETLKIAGNAVTVPVSAYSVGNIAVVADWVEVISASILLSGEPVMVNVSATIRRASTAANEFDVQLRRGSTVIADFSELFVGAGVNGATPFCYSISDQPVAGEHTYALYIRGETSSSLPSPNYNVSLRSLVLLSTKR